MDYVYVPFDMVCCAVSCLACHFAKHLRDHISSHHESSPPLQLCNLHPSFHGKTKTLLRAVHVICHLILIATSTLQQMGYGEMFYYSLSHSQLGEYDYLVKGCLILSGFLFYIFDIDEWNTAFGSLFRFISLSAMFAIFVFIVILVSNDVPFGIITLFALLNPLWLLMVNRLFYRDRDTRTFVSWLSGPLLLIAVLTLVSFIVWVWIDYSNEWNDVTKIEAAERTGCMANFEDYPNCYSQDATGSTCFYVDYSGEHQVLVFPDGCDPSCMNVYDSCSNGFMLWGGPILICLSNLFLSFFGTFLRKGEF